MSSPPLFAIYLQTQDDILSQENKATARSRYKTDPEKKASVRDSYTADREKKKASVRDSYKADPEKKKASVRDSYKADPEQKVFVRDSYKADPEKKKATATIPIPKRRPLGPYATATTQILNLSNLLKSSDIKRTSRRTALLKARNTRTMHLNGIGNGMTRLSDWLNVLPRGRGSAGVTELPLPPKGMSWHVVLH